MAAITPENSMGSATSGKVGAALKRYRKLEDDRSSWRAQWQEITDYLLPRRGRYLTESQGNKGRKRNNKIVDNSAGQALRTLAAGMMSGLTSPTRPWFRFQTRDDRLMDEEGVKAYLGEVEAVMRRVLAGSNFYNSVSSLYTELGAFGTGVLYRRKHPQQVVHYRPLTAGEYVIAENSYNQVDTLGREFTMTVAQIVEQFVFDEQTGNMDWEKCSPTVKNLWKQKNYDQLINVVHMIQPRRQKERDMAMMDGVNRPYADLYFEKGAKNSDGEPMLQEGGHGRRPFFAVRWDVLGGDVYGYSPAMEQLGDIKQLQHEQRRKAQAIDKMVNPPMTAPTSLKGRPTTVIAGGTTYVDNMNGGAGFQPAYLVQPRIQEMLMDIQEVQGRIQRGFYADLFAMMINSDRRQMTATEVTERHEEKLALLGPVLQRMNTELLDPLLEDLFIICEEEGLLPEAPEALAGTDIEIKYVSLLAQAQEASAASSMERSVAFAGNLAGIAPDVLDNLDLDEAVREYVEILGGSPKLLREVNARDEMRAERAEAQQRAELAAQANQGADTARLLSEADTQNPNALTELLGRGESTNV
jgi:hypothetical protein